MGIEEAVMGFLDEIFSGASGASGVTYPDAINAKPSNTDDVCVDVCIYDASRDHAPHTPLTPHPITPEKCQTSNTEANLREIPVPCSPRIQEITRATNPDELVGAMSDYIPGQLSDSDLIELTKAYELKMAEFLPENQPILDPGGAIRAFNACRTTKELWEATCRIDPGDWPSEVFGRVWDCYTAVEGRLVEQGEPRVFHYFERKSQQSPEHVTEIRTRNSTTGHWTRLATFQRPEGELRFSWNTFDGRPYLRLQLWSKGEDGEFWPVKGQGFSIKVRELPDLADGIQQALDMALKEPQSTPPGKIIIRGNGQVLSNTEPDGIRNTLGGKMDLTTELPPPGKRMSPVHLARRWPAITRGH
jgi:hypothetical protein